MARKTQAESISGYTILLVDDNPEYLEITRLLLEDEGHRVLAADNGPAALAVLRQEPVDLLLLDYLMPGMTGEEVVSRLRQFNPYVQVILQTGYASEQPPRDMLRRLDIQGYHDKSEGPEKLLLWTDAGLKAAYTIQLLYKSRQGLRYILDVTPDLHKIQPLEDLLQGILWQVAGLLGVVNSFLAVLPEGEALRSDSVETESFLALLEEDTGLVIRSSTGRFMGQRKVNDCLEPQKIEMIVGTLRQGEIQVVGTTTVVPLRVGEMSAGVIYLDRPIVQEKDVELLHLFANQAAVAIQNAQLYQMSTIDPLTGVYVRRFLDQCLMRELRTAFRSQQYLALLMLDLDSMKQINDTAGHLVGDQALASLGKVLRQATRGSDFVGRYGGDEFAIILPQTRPEAAEHVGHRILEFMQDKNVPGPNGQFRLAGSIGLCTLAPHALTASEIPRPIPQVYFRSMSENLIQLADHALYKAKRSGGNCLHQGQMLEWPPITAATDENYSERAPQD